MEKEDDRTRICRECGREYIPEESDAEDKEHFCCIACEWGM